MDPPPRKKPLSSWWYCFCFQTSHNWGWSGSKTLQTQMKTNPSRLRAWCRVCDGVLDGSHLLVDLRSGYLLQVFQVGVEQVAAGQRDPQNRLDDVTDGAVVGQSNLLCRVHEVAATKTRYFKNMDWSFLYGFVLHFFRLGFVCFITWPMDSSLVPDPGSRKNLLPQLQTRSSLVSVGENKNRYVLYYPILILYSHDNEVPKRTILLSASLSVASMGRSRLGLPMYRSWVWGYWDKCFTRVRTFT